MGAKTKTKKDHSGGSTAPLLFPPLPRVTDLAPRTRKQIGKGARLAGEVEPALNADWAPPAGRRDPVAVLEAESAERIAELIPIRYGRMLASPFTFFRGTAAIMAADLGPLPTSNLRAQSCGDAHLLNFGVFAAADRRLVFDLNDFDETLPAPFEWDLKRLATSCVVAAQDIGADEATARSVAAAATAAYQSAMWECASMRHLDLFYDRVEIAPDLPVLRKHTDKDTLTRVQKDFAKAQTRTSVGSLDRYADRQHDGTFRIREDVPLIERLATPQAVEQVEAALARYLETLSPERAAVVRQYRFQDAARKVVGVGSVGVEAYMALLIGDRDDDPLFLQLKEAGESVLAPHAGPSAYDHAGERVVRGQQAMQSAGDLFLGWLRREGDKTTDYYVRQLRDKKGSIKIERLSAAGLRFYAEACGAVLARAHARSGRPGRIAGYLGQDQQVVEAVTEFAVRYARQNQHDYEALLQAEADGRIEVLRGR